MKKTIIFSLIIFFIYSFGVYADDDEIVISVPETRQKTGVFGRNIFFGQIEQRHQHHKMTVPVVDLVQHLKFIFVAFIIEQ